jgi:Zn-dependent protease
MHHLSAILQSISVWAIPVVIAITFHEAAHGWVAWRLGDDTAMRMGRVTFNPLRHVDAFGTIVLPGLLLALRAPFLFGYAKPVPVDFGRLRAPRRDMILVAAAGPGINLLLAFISALAFHGIEYVPDVARPWLAENLRNSLLINLILAVFNLLPIPPLDGGRIAVGLLPMPAAFALARLEPYGVFLVLGVGALLPLVAGEFGFDVNPLAWAIGLPVDWLFDAIVELTGLR